MHATPFLLACSRFSHRKRNGIERDISSFVLACSWVGKRNLAAKRSWHSDVFLFFGPQVVIIENERDITPFLLACSWGTHKKEEATKVQSDPQ